MYNYGFKIKNDSYLVDSSIWDKCNDLPDFWKKQKLEAILFSMIIGVTLLVAAKISNQRIGYGDGIIFLILGLWIGFWDGISLLFFSLILSSIISVYLIIVRRKGRDYRIPFIPFVTAAYIILEGARFLSS